ncbi:Protein CBG27144 [Caenorhabditis briggsae]|uniref:Protein CBG27144 n=1 Tax=Caenorhabditis briggsae TaxID=6238 RepID=B6IL54_CAEBR|nr:Protein CBG27144 [Caenorhabditis briggsae]CAS00607.1 Protein CBG27144 [Caenorhabditis briggsae]
MDAVYPVYSSLVSSFRYRASSAGPVVAAVDRKVVVFHSSKAFLVVGEVEVGVARETTKSEAVCTLLLLRLFKSVTAPKCRQPSSFSLPAVSHDVILEESESSEHEWKKAKRCRKITFDLSMHHRDNELSHL